MLSLFWLWLPAWSWAINSNQWHMEAIQVEDGLPDSTVYSVVQDQHGFMWFGTTQGLARYDGHEFKLFVHDGADPNSISNNNAGNIFLDSNNKLWIGTFGGGVNTLDLNRGELLRYPYSSSLIDTMVSENVQTFYENQAGGMWIGTSTGLYLLKNDQLTHYNHDENDPTSLRHPRVWDILQDQQGQMWVATSEGLSEFDPHTGQFSNHMLPEEMTIDMASNQFRTLHLDSDLLWIGSSSGLYSFNMETKAFEFHSPNARTIKINDIHSITPGLLLIASMEGLFEYDTQKNVFKHDVAGNIWQPLSHLDIRNMYTDQSGLLWLATRDNGVMKIDDTGGLFQHHRDYTSSNLEGEKHKQVWALEADQQGTLYLGTSDTVFKSNDEAGFSRVAVENLTQIPGIIRDIEVASRGGHWVAGSMGLFYLPEDETVAHVSSEPFELAGIQPTDVFSVTETAAGEVWLALYNVGILRWQPLQSQASLIQSYAGGPLSDLNLNYIFADRSGDVWIASHLVGLFRYRTGQDELTLYSHDFNDSSSLSSNRVNYIFEDSAGRLWVGTARGLNLFNRETSTFRHFTQASGMLSNPINAILEDSKQNIWAVYKFGLSRLNPVTEDINSYVLNAAIRNDGLVIRAATIDTQDVMYFGSADGYYSFDPRELKSTKAYQPPLMLTQVRINNRPKPFGALLAGQTAFELDNNHRSITFDFSALDFKSPEQIQYHYRMLGLHEDWLDVSESRRIELNNLNPGQYQLEIKATNNDGRWTDQQMSLSLKVHPEWWNRGWVRLLFVLTGMLLALAIHHYRTFKIRQQNLNLEAQVNSRTTELRDLNEQLKLAANSDFLTGLPNRMAFIDSYEHKQKQRDQQPLNSCIVLADIDHFKQINDRYGHNAGDEILKQVSQIMHDMIRHEDLMARWGGEEFIFYFENKDSAATMSMVERIRKAVENHEVQYLDHHIPVTLTFGVCQKLAGMSLIDCINAADAAMYSGKSQGRNQSVLYRSGAE